MSSAAVNVRVVEQAAVHVRIQPATVETRIAGGPQGPIGPIGPQGPPGTMVDVDVRDFGDIHAGGDVSEVLQAGIDYVKANGGRLRVPAGEFTVKNIRLEGGDKPWALVGDGKYQTVFKHLDGDGTLFFGPESSVGYTLQGFTIDAQHSVYDHGSAGNGIAIYDTNDVTIRDVLVRDYKLSGILIWAQTPNTFGRCKMIDCEADGLDEGVNGFLFVDMDFCVYERCAARNIVTTGDGPGIGVQFKNACRWGTLANTYSENCNVGFGLAGDSTIGPTFLTAVNVKAVACTTGVRLGNGAAHNTITNVFVDQQDSTTSDAIDFQTAAIRNSVTGVVAIQIGALKRGALFRTDANDNYVEFAHVDDVNSTGVVATFATGVLRNRVRLRRMTNPVIHANGVRSLASFADAAANGNSFSYDDYEPWENLVIASGEIVLRNAASRHAVIDTEASASSDDLVTITGYAAEGTLLTLRTANSGRDVVLKHNTGNIFLLGAADVTLAARTRVIALRYNAVEAKWCEVA